MVSTGSSHRPRILGALLLALVVALVLLAARSPAGAADLVVVDTIQIDAGPQAHAVGHVVLDASKKYELDISGSTHRALGPDFSDYDALYCYGSSSPTACSPPFPESSQLQFSSQVGDETPSGSSLQDAPAFTGSPLPAFDGGHQYAFPFTGTGGKLFVETWAFLNPAEGETLSGSFTITILGPASDADAARVKCQRAIAKSSAAYFTARIEAVAKCQKAKLAGKLPQIDCLAEAKTRAAIDKAQDKLQTTIDAACGGRDKLCGTADDVPLDKLGFGNACPDFEAFGCTNSIRLCNDIETCLICIDAAAADQAMGLIGKAGPSDPKAQKPLNQCQHAIVDSAVHFLTTVAGIYEQCDDKVLQSKSVAQCVDGPKGTRIGDLEAKLSTAIEKKCNDAKKGFTFTSTQIGFTGACPRVHPPSISEPNFTCFGTFSDVADVTHCLDCIGMFKAECAVFAATPAVQPYPRTCSSEVVR